jgi:hypothetical protein
VASILPNFRKKRQPTHIIELNAGYYFQSAADKVRIWNKVRHYIPRQSLSFSSLRGNFTPSTSHQTRKRGRKKKRPTRLLKLISNSAEKERRYGKKTKKLTST